MWKVWIAVAVAVCALASDVARADFVFPSFTPAPPGLDLIGNPTAPTVVGGNLRLTTNATNQAAAAWYDVKQNVANGFTTTFRFQVSGGVAIPFATPSDTGADGVAFVIQNNNTSALGNNGSGIGYSGIANSLAVEADTFWNTNISILGNPIASTNGDPDGNHVSIQSNGMLANSDNITASRAIALSAVLPNMSDGAPHTVRVTYTPGLMSVYVDDLTTPKLTNVVDLATLLSLSNGQAFVGLTSATGQAAENHDVLDWSFTQAPEPSGLAALALVV
jgi:hypothetical protein